MESTRQFNIKIHGNDYQVDIKKVDEGNAVVEVNGTQYEVQFERVRKVSKTPTLVRKPVYHSEEDRPKSTSAPAESKAKGVKSPLPGVILELKVGTGQKVKAGQLLLVMEAMKMENNIVAPSDGTVTALKVAKGDNVMEGDLLVEIGD
ncbi:MAG: acetyl-CoA carboxylase biotin carboxyl carrier protein subunit [Ectothiorhodospiraceae bacterium]|nr:acetyl-CoA carboxylase biotin carboxyl carrier protein subunit [Ectothiorhodospiraceae bacterium]